MDFQYVEAIMALRDGTPMEGQHTVLARVVFLGFCPFGLNQKPTVREMSFLSFTPYRCDIVVPPPTTAIRFMSLY